jgi:hypothetical protein
VSLQFVCYGFHRKGIVYRELWWLPILLKNYRLHLMFHELWVGHGVFSTPKNNIVGAIQRLFIRILVKIIRPSVVDTSNEFYRRSLLGIGVKSGILPMFGAIPVAPAKGTPWIFADIRANGGPDLSRDRSGYWLSGIFGHILDHWPAEKLFDKLSNWAAAAGRHVIVAMVGVTSTHKAALRQRWAGQFPSIHFIDAGPRSPREVSEFFSALDFGVTSHPFYTLGKSSSVAAMLEHGLPVISDWGDIAPGITPVSTPLSRLIWQDDRQLRDRLLSPSLRVACVDMADRVTGMMLERFDSQEPRDGWRR